MQRDDVGAPQQLAQQPEAHAERVLGVLVKPRDVVVLDPHAERARQPSHLLADGAEPDDAERLVEELVQARRGLLPRQRPAATLAWVQISRRDTVSISISACSATEMALAPPLLAMGTCARRAASRSTLS